MTLVARTVSGVSWTTGAKIAQQALQFGLSIVLMRLLGPESFGLIAMVLVFSGFAAVFSEMGVGSALVQRQTITDAHWSTAFWFTVALGILLSGLFALAAPLVARFYGEPVLMPLTAWIAASFTLSTPGIVPRARLQRSMRFDRIAKIDIVALLVSGVVAATAAWRGAGVWSLVAQHLTVAAVTSVLLLATVKWRPGRVWSGPALRDLAGYGAGLTGFAVINYWARSADNLLIGRFLGTATLGLYSRAYFLMLMPLKQIIGVLTPVMFPALASIQSNRDRVRRAYLRAMRLITFIAFPLMLGLAVVAEPFVLGLFGAGWREVIPLIRILAFVGITQTLCNPVGWIYTSQGRTDWLFWWGVGGAGALIAAILVGIAIGTVEAVAWAYLAGNVLITVPCLAIPGKLIDMRVRDVFRVVSGNFACALLMAIVVWGVDRLLPSTLHPLATLAILVPVGIASHLAIAWRSHLAALPDLYALARQLSLRPG